MKWIRFKGTNSVVTVHMDSCGHQCVVCVDVTADKTRFSLIAKDTQCVGCFPSHCSWLVQGMHLMITYITMQ